MMDRQEFLIIAAALCMKPNDDADHRAQAAKTAKASAEALASLFDLDADSQSRAFANEHMALSEANEKIAQLQDALESANIKIASLEEALNAHAVHAAVTTESVPPPSLDSDDHHDHKSKKGHGR